MEELLKKLNELKDQISGYQARIKDLEDKGGKYDELKALVDSQKDEMDNLIAKVERQGVAGLNKDDSAKAKAIANFAAMARGDYKDVLRTDSNKDGGFLITPEIEAGILHLAATEGSMRAIADVRNTNRNSVVLNVRVSGAAAGHVGEAEERSTTDGPEYAQVEIPIHTQYAQPEITNEALEDADEDLAAEIMAAIAEALGTQDESDFITGTGVKMPRGLLSYTEKLCAKQADLEWGKMGYVKTGKAAALADASKQNVFIDAKKLLHVRYRTNARLLINSNTAAELEKLADTTGRPLWTEGIKEGQPARFLGIPVEINDYMPDINNAASLPFALIGDFKKGYAIRDRKGMTLTRDSITHKGFVKFYTEKRTGAGIKNFKAIVAIKAIA
jgi:HK97 family phage major capsid protein